MSQLLTLVPLLYPFESITAKTSCSLSAPPAKAHSLSPGAAWHHCTGPIGVGTPSAWEWLSHRPPVTSAWCLHSSVESAFAGLHGPWFGSPVNSRRP